MKKFVFIYVFVMMLSTVIVHGETQYKGSVKETNVVTYINDHSIPSYNLNGYTFVKVEDLQYYGFDVKWNEYNKTLRILRNNINKVSERITFRSKPQNIGRELFQMYSTDIRTYIEDYEYEIECLAGLPGYTFINVDNLSAFGKVEWVPDTESVKIWIEDGLEMNTLQIPIRYDISDVKVSNFTCGTMNHYYWNSWGTKDNFYVDFSVADFVNGEITECAKCYGKLYVKIIDTEGKTIYDGKMDFWTTDYSLLPYYFNFMDTPLSLEFEIPKKNILPTANSNGEGLVKLYYWCDACDYGLDCEFKTDKLSN